MAIRRLMLALLIFGLVGTSAELLLIEHFEDWRQQAPLWAFLAAALVAVAAFVRPTTGVLQAFRAVMVILVGLGLLGLYFHYTGNAEFELEMRPSMAGWELIWESLRGATPALAPGTSVQFGLLGLLATYKHPALAAESQPETGA